jgi:hypothetical protein
MLAFTVIALYASAAIVIGLPAFAYVVHFIKKHRTSNV